MHIPVGQTRLVLASASPRRRELLGQLGIPFEVSAADIDETPHPGEAAAAYVLRLAREKARAVAARHPDACVLAADTTVALADALLGKPRDAAEAREMLGRLSGRSHDVHTGVALVRPGPGHPPESSPESSLQVRTRVTFRALGAGEIAWYVATGEPLDKAGSYAIQGKGGFLVASVDGSPTNVIGLPLGETLELLARAGFALPWSPMARGPEAAS